jgi:hypothetical protein
VSGKIIPLKKPEPAWPAPPSPWILGEVFTRDGVDYELVTAGEIRVVEVERGARTIGQAPCSVFDLLVDAGALVGDHVLVLRPLRPA